MDERQIIEVARKAAINSAKFYYEISDGFSIHEGAIETLVSSEIARCIHKEAKLHVQLEVPFKKIFKWSGAETRGRVRDELSRGRLDVAIFKDKKPVGVIEVKKRFAPYRADKDMRRVSSSVDRFGDNHNGSIRFGAWIAIQRILENQRISPEDRVENFKSRFNLGNLYESVDYNMYEGQLGLTRTGKSVVGLISYSVLFRYQSEKF